MPNKPETCSKLLDILLGLCCTTLRGCGHGSTTGDLGFSFPVTSCLFHDASHWDFAGFSRAMPASCGWGSLPSSAQRACVILAVNYLTCPGLIVLGQQLQLLGRGHLEKWDNMTHTSATWSYGPKQDALVCKCLSCPTLCSSPCFPVRCWSVANPWHMQDIHSWMEVDSCLCVTHSSEFCFKNWRSSRESLLVRLSVLCYSLSSVRRRLSFTNESPS